MEKITTSMLLLLFGVLLASCEKPILENESKVKAGEMNIVFNVSAIEMVPFPALSPQSRSMVSIDQVCSRISLALFKGEEKVKSVNQTRRDAHFGRLTVTVPKGTYKVVIIAHNGAGTDQQSFQNQVYQQQSDRHLLLLRRCDSRRGRTADSHPRTSRSNVSAQH